MYNTQHTDQSLSAMSYSSYRSLLRRAPFFFNDPAPTEIYTLSLHDALPICGFRNYPREWWHFSYAGAQARGDRKSTRLNSSHVEISYAVFCLKKKKTNNANFKFADAV